MQRNTKFITLMAALATGVAAAAAPTPNPNNYTASGVTIENVATSSFTDPANSAQTITGTSNTVRTTVLPLPGFDIVYGSGAADGGGTDSNKANGINSAIAAPDYRTDIKPGDTVTNTYYLVNNGNTPLNVQIAANTTGNSAANATSGIGSLSPSAVTYTYADSAGTAVTANNGTVTLPVNAYITVTQSFVVPAGAAPGTLYGASPVGTVVGTGTTANGVTTGQTLGEGQTVSSGTPSAAPAATTDLQFTVVKIYDPVLANSPTAPGGNVTPPGTTTPTPGYTATTPPTTGNGAPPTSGTAPGTTLITVSGDQQFAYPPADTETANPDVVRFKNTVTNGGTLTDTISLLPVNSTGAGAVTGFTKTSTGTYTGTNADGKTVTVQFLDANNNPIDSVTVGAKASADYTTQVTYPDSNSLPNQHVLDLIIKATSGNNPNVSDLTTDTIQPTQAQFGDTSSLTSPPTNTLAVNPNTAQSQTGTPGSNVSYAMSVANTGTYTDSYTLSGYVTVTLKDNSTRTVPVVYSGTNVTQTGTTTVNGVTFDTYTVSNVAPNTSAPLTATVTIPADAAATGTSAAAGTLPLPAPTLQQTASSVYSDKTTKGPGSGLSLTDTNNLLVVSVAGGVVTGKFTQTTGAAENPPTPAANTQKVTGNPGVPSSGAPSATEIGNPAGYDALATQGYLPQQAYKYDIIAKNNYNTGISNFRLSDKLQRGLQYVSATCTVYSSDQANKTVVTSPTVATAAGTGADAGTTTVTCAATTLQPGQIEILEITVKVQ